MRLRALSDRVQIFCGPPVNVGLLLFSSNRVALVDSGLDKRYARKILETLEDYKYQLVAIFNTHAHADHIGGNSFLANATGCKIFAGKLEVPAIQNPLMQPIALFGAAPFPELMNNFLMAEPSHSEEFSQEYFEIDEIKINIIDLPGHSIGQKGFLVDGVAFVADSLFPVSALEKHKLLYMFDPFVQSSTFDTLNGLQADWYVGGHFEPEKKISPILTRNKSHVEEVFSALEVLLAVPQSFDRLLKEFLGHFGVRKEGWEHFLYRATLNSYLSTLKRIGKANFKVLDNLLLWFSTSK